MVNHDSPPSCIASSDRILVLVIPFSVAVIAFVFSMTTDPGDEK